MLDHSFHCCTYYTLLQRIKCYNVALGWTNKVQSLRFMNYLISAFVEPHPCAILKHSIHHKEYYKYYNNYYT